MNIRKKDSGTITNTNSTKLTKQERLRIQAENESEYDELVKAYQDSIDEQIEINTKEIYVTATETMMQRGNAFLCSIAVLEDNKLSAFEKVLFFTLSSLSYNKGYCWATNRFFAEKFNVSESTIKRALAKLRKEDFIAEDPSLKVGVKRHIHIQFIKLRLRYGHY